MITEKRLLKISSRHALVGLAISLFFWFVIFDMGICHAQTQTGYRIPARLDIGGGRMTGDMWCQYGTNGVRFKIGTQAVSQVGTVGVINGTNVTSLPSLDFTYAGGSISANFNGFNAVYVSGSQVGTSGAMSGKLDAVSGIGTNNTFNNPTLAGLGTITASFGANGLVISPTEYSYVDGLSSNAQTQINTKLTQVGSVTTYLGSVTAGGKTGTSSFSLNDGTDISFTSTLTGDGFLAITANVSGSSSVKANIQIGGTVSTTSASAINFPSRDFTGTTTGTVADLTFLHNVPAVMSVQSLIEYQRLRQGTLSNTFYGYSFVDAYIDNSGTGSTSNCTWYGTPTYAILMNYQPTTGSFTATAGGTSTADSLTEGFPALNACDGSEATAWYSLTGAPPHWWKYDYGTGTEKNVQKIRVKPLGGTYGPQGFIFQGSNDNTAWTNVYTGTCTDSSAWQDFSFTNRAFYRMYRFYATSSYIGSGDIDIYEFEFLETLGTATTASYESKSYSFLEVPNRLSLGLVMIGDIGSITAQVSRDGGITYSTATISAVGTSGYVRTSSMVDVSGQPSNNKVQFKVLFGSSTTTRITGAGVFGY